MFSYGPDILHQRQLACLITWTTISEPRRLCQVETGTEGHKNSFFSLQWWLWDYSAPLPMVFKVSLLHRWGEIHQVLLWLLCFLLCLGLTLRYDAWADTAGRSSWSTRRMRWHCWAAKVKLRQKLGTFPCATVKNRVWRKRRLNVSTQHIYITR